MLTAQPSCSWPCGRSFATSQGHKALCCLWCPQRIPSLTLRNFARNGASSTSPVHPTCPTPTEWQWRLSKKWKKLFRPRSAHQEFSTDLSLMPLIFGQDIRNSLLITRASLTPEHRIVSQERLQKVPEERRKGKEEELLKQGQKGFVQHQGSKRWTSTVAVLRFGINDGEYIIWNDQNGGEYCCNRKFLRPQHVQPVTPPRQPVAASDLFPLQKFKVPS